MADQFGFEPQQIIQVLVTIGLALLIGWEREEQSSKRDVYLMGGVRTFPVIALIGYGLAVIAPGNATCSALGLLAVGGFLLVSYLHKLRSGPHGATTEMSALAVYVIGALVANGFVWLACAIGVGMLILLNAKAPLESFAKTIPRREISILIQFLLLAAVILPVLPNQDYTAYKINPFNTWLIVVAVSGISYASYVVQKLMRGGRSELITAALGGTYSSTATTVVLAKASKHNHDPRLYIGAITMASSVMYLRVAILLWIFNLDLGWVLGPKLIGLGILGGVYGCTLATLNRKPREVDDTEAEDAPRNPLELGSALLFAGLFVVITVGTRMARQYMGDTGLYALASVMGVTDVDPFILGLTQMAGKSVAINVAAVAVLIATASNNVLKGAYAIGFGERRVGVGALLSVLALGALSFLALIGM